MRGERVPATHLLRPVDRVALRAMAPVVWTTTAGASLAALVLLLLQTLARSPVEAPTGVVAQVGLLLVPAALELAVPLAVVAGAAVAGSRLSEEGALVALGAAGVPARRLLPPVLALSLAAAGLHATLGHQLAPRGRAAARELLADQLGALRLRPGVPAVVGRSGLLLRATDAAPEADGWRGLFVATGDLVAVAERGWMRPEGVLVMEAGQIRDLRAEDGWTLRFAEAEVPVLAAAPRVELAERSSPRLRDLVHRMEAAGRDARYEALTLRKRTTAPLALPLLAAFALAGAARTRRPGALVAGTMVAWWATLRLGDKSVAALDVFGAAALPLVACGVGAAAAWAAWRMR